MGNKITYTKTLENFFKYYTNKKNINADISVLNDPEIREAFESLWEQAKDEYSARQINASAIGHENKLTSGYYQSETHKNSAINGGKSAGKIVGNRYKENGRLEELIKMRTEASLERIKCDVCGGDANTGNYSRWHGVNCKYDDFISFFNLLPLEFTRKQARVIAKDNNYPNNYVRMLLYTEPYGKLWTKIHEGTNGSITDVPIFQKICK
jgi:hypothetical protein